MPDCVEIEARQDLVADEPIPRAEVPKPPLRGLVLRGSAWTFAGYGGAQLMRLAGNLILTRLLAPEIFGGHGDRGAVPSGPRDVLGRRPRLEHRAQPRGDDPEFLDTVWTIQVARGFLLGLGAIVIARACRGTLRSATACVAAPGWRPCAVAQGFASTAIFTSNRHLTLGRLTAMELSAQAATIVATASLALLRPTAWAVIGGGIIGALAKTFFSFTMLPGARNRPAWDRSALSEILRFGKWLTLSTILTFFAGSGDRVILGYVLSPRELGVYAIAFFMSQAVLTAVRSLSTRIFFPLYTRIGEVDAVEVRGRLRNLQAVLLAVVLPPICVLRRVGPRDHRLLVRPPLSRGRLDAPHPVGRDDRRGLDRECRGSRPCQREFVSLHDPLGLRAAVLLVSMLVGGELDGTRGLILGVALEPLLCYPAMALVSRRYGTWMPSLDLAALLGSAALIGVGLWVSGW